MNNSKDLFILKDCNNLVTMDLFRIASNMKGFIYEKGKWQESNEVFNYYPDPSPDQYINEEKANEIMKILDERDNNLSNNNFT